MYYLSSSGKLPTCYRQLYGMTAPNIPCNTYIKKTKAVCKGNIPRFVISFNNDFWGSPGCLVQVCEIRSQFFCCETQRVLLEMVGL